MQRALFHAPSPRICRAVIALLAALVWGITVKYDFAWDDHSFIIDNQAIRSLKNIPAMFYSRIAEASHPNDFPNFRPMRNVAYALLFQLGGQATPQPWIFHLANVLGHTVAALLLFATASLLFLPAGESPSRWAALLTGAAFAVHPAASEVVCWAKGLDDILAAIFVLAAARQLLLWHGEKRRLAAALAFFAVAVYAKESAVPFAGLVFFLLRACHNLPWKRSALLTAPFLVVAGMYVAHRELMLGQAAQCAPISGAYAQTLLDTIPAITIYFRLLWGVPPFSIDYTDMRGHLRFLSLSVMTGLALLLLWAAAAWTAWRGEKFRPAAVGLLWLAFFLLPVSNLVPMMQYLAERFLYLSLIGWLLALGAVWARAPQRLASLGLAAALFALWIPVSLARQAVWRDEVTLFVRSSLDHPANKRLRENALTSIFALPQMHSAFGLDDTTRRLQADSSIPRSQGEAMLPTLRQAHQLLPDEHRLTAALGISYAVAGQISNAVPFLELAARQGSNDVQCWIDLGSAYALENNLAKARQAWETALRLEPANRLASEHLRALNAK
jgi:tetratricopeptide (TPR) repeat protein